MNKLTLDNFTGGLQELTAAEDFTLRQWSQLKGFVPNSTQVFETQWPIQTIGSSYSGFQAVFPLTCEQGIFLTAIKTDGTLWWTPAPAYNAGYLDVNAKTWTQITDADNIGWADGNTTTQPALTITANPELRFICAVPVKAYKYIREPYAGREAAGDSPAIPADKDNPAKDTDKGGFIQTAMFSGVLLNTAEKTSGNKHFQQVVLFIDTTNPASIVVRAIVFPNYRRFPTRTWEKDDGWDSADFITAAYIDNDEGVDIDTFPNWPTNMSAINAPEVRMHPYTWVDIDGTLRPGRGIIPRANVGCMKVDRLILGDVEWRKDYSFKPPTLDDVTLPTIGTAPKNITLTSIPKGAQTLMGATIFNNGPGTAYFGDSSTVASSGSRIGVKKCKRVKTWPGPFNLVVGSGAPSAGTGSDGDYYYDTANTRLYGPKASGAWPVSTLTFTTGSGAPSTTGAINGRYYIDTSSSPTPATSWKVYGAFADIVTLTLRESPAGITNGSTVIRVADVGPNYNGTFVVTNHSTSSPYYVQYVNQGAALAEKTVAKGSVFIGSNFKLKAEPGDTVSIPHEWDTLWAAASAANTTIVQKFNVDIAYHYLNDTNTGPFRSGFYFAHEDIDEFDPRSALAAGRTDVRIAGMHAIDETVIIITTAGGEGDGVYRVRGYFGSLNPYDNSVENPNAVRVELIKGGIGAPPRTTLTGGHLSYSCLWKATNTVVFIDRMGGVYYTNGSLCERLDRIGPRKPSVATEYDHVADVGEYLMVYRNNRLLCFTLLDSDGTNGTGCWTELVKPTGTIKSMVGAREDLYFVCDGKVMRIATAGLDVERGKIDNVAQTLTVATPTIGSQDEHDRTNWHQFGMTFTTPTSCAVSSVQVQSTGSLNTVGGVTSPTVAYSTVPASATYDKPAVLQEFVVPAGIGPQNAVSATVNFTGYVRLESAAFWYTGREPRRGDL